MRRDRRTPTVGWAKLAGARSAKAGVPTTTSRQQIISGGHAGCAPLRPLSPPCIFIGISYKFRCRQTSFPPVAGALYCAFGERSAMAVLDDRRRLVEH